MIKKVLFIANFFIASSHLLNAQTEEWKMLASQEGVEFYVAHYISKISPTVNSIIKIQNTTEQQVAITFTPLYACKVGGPFMAFKTEIVYLNTEHRSSTHNYTFCENRNIPQIQIQNIQIQIKP
ncbi:MAG: hypothetical protein NZM38_01525 [Cytophagales bacterium]|nr:hypothetical protein [Cytophagales bacterium]MDW8383431.1 hypothetical protein [Flammeovirgaceae bacterium]